MSLRLKQEIARMRTALFFTPDLGSWYPISPLTLQRRLAILPG